MSGVEIVTAVTVITLSISFHQASSPASVCLEGFAQSSLHVCSPAPEASKVPVRAHSFFQQQVKQSLHQENA